MWSRVAGDRNCWKRLAGKSRALAGERYGNQYDSWTHLRLLSSEIACYGNSGRVDVLINAAGTTLKKPTLEVKDAEWEGMLRVNLTGLLHCCQEFHRPLKESGAGRVINIASLSSYLAFHQVATYSATKAGVLSLTRSLACEWARTGSA